MRLFNFHFNIHTYYYYYHIEVILIKQLTSYLWIFKLIKKKRGKYVRLKIPWIMNIMRYIVVVSVLCMFTVIILLLKRIPLYIITIPSFFFFVLNSFIIGIIEQY